VAKVGKAVVEQAWGVDEEVGEEERVADSD
jgi:hypothetical protein